MISMKKLLAISLLLLCASVGAQDTTLMRISTNMLHSIMAQYRDTMAAASAEEAAGATQAFESSCTQVDLEAWVTAPERWDWHEADWDRFNSTFAPIVFGDDVEARNHYFSDAAEQMGYTCDR